MYIAVLHWLFHLLDIFAVLKVFMWLAACA